MIRTVQSVDVARPPDETFAFLDEPSNAPRWMSMCRSLEQTSPPPKGVGTTMRYSRNQDLGGGAMDGVVTQYEPGRRLEMTFVDRYFEVVVSFAVVPRGTGSRVTCASAITPVGFAAKLMSPMIRAAAAQQMATDAAKLKEVLEA